MTKKTSFKWFKLKLSKEVNCILAHKFTTGATRETGQKITEHQHIVDLQQMPQILK